MRSKTKCILIPTYYVFLKIPSLDVEQGPVHLFQVEEKLCCQSHEVSQRQSEETHVYPLSKPLTIEDDGVEDVGGKPKQEQNRSGSGVDDDFKEELSLFIKKATFKTHVDISCLSGILCHLLKLISSLGLTKQLLALTRTAA